MRGKLALLGLAVAIVAAALGAAPGLAQGPSPAQLAEQGWTCFVPCRGRGALLQPGPGPPADPAAGGGRTRGVHGHGLLVAGR